MIDAAAPEMHRNGTTCSGPNGQGVAAHPSRHLLVVFRRNPGRDAHEERIRYEGYRLYWPEGDAVSVGFSRFCQQGTRVLGLGRRMRGREELLVELGFHPVYNLESPFPRFAAGTRTRRFYLEQSGRRARLYFFNGSPTEVEFDVLNDDPRILDWLGLPMLAEPCTQWFDLSARTLDHTPKHLLASAPARNGGISFAHINS